MSESTFKQYQYLLIKAEAARAVGDLEDYRELKNQAFEVVLAKSVQFAQGYFNYDKQTKRSS